MRCVRSYISSPPARDLGAPSAPSIPNLFALARPSPSACPAAHADPRAATAPCKRWRASAYPRWSGQRPPQRPLVSARMRLAPLRLLAALVLLGGTLGGTLAGCGKGAGRATSHDGSDGSATTARAGGVVAISTKNTTRLGGADASTDAAAVARAVYPGLTPATRPQAVALVDDRDWAGALAASVLAGATPRRAAAVRPRRLAAGRERSRPERDAPARLSRARRRAGDRDRKLACVGGRRAVARFSPAAKPTRPRWRRRCNNSPLKSPGTASAAC